MKTQLEIYREQIDEIDKTLAENFERRMEIVSMIAEYKKQNNIATFDPAREEKMLEKNQSYIKNDMLKKYYVDVLKKQLEVSKQYQEELKTTKK